MYELRFIVPPGRALEHWCLYFNGHLLAFCLDKDKFKRINARVVPDETVKVDEMPIREQTNYEQYGRVSAERLRRARAGVE